MKHDLVDLDETGCFSDFFLDYIAAKDQLSPFYGNLPTLEAFGDQIEQKKLPEEHRAILVSSLKEQYTGTELTPEVSRNLDMLASEKTYTITTGHQLNIFTGPLYVIYKIVTVIRACEELGKHYPDYNFVPVYWMASEDHDFDEINHFYFNNHKYEWETTQKGAVGRFSLSDMKPLLDDLSAIPTFFQHAYRNNETLSGAVREYMNALFGKFGLVVLDADNHRQKGLLRPMMRKDILSQENADSVRKATEQLKKIGYTTPVNPREINFFYLSPEGRFRIEKSGSSYSLVDGNKTFTEKEIQDEIENNPENFSPNVVLRPYYQELILPNLAYVGGPSELVYWLQLKSIFDENNLVFPILLPRNFGLIITHPVERKRIKTGLPLDDYFIDTDKLLNEKVRDHSSKELSLSKETEVLDEVFKSIHQRAVDIDFTLGQHVEAQQAKLHNILRNIEKKFVRAEKRNNDDLVNQILSIKNSIFPGGTFQERRENFLSFYQDNDGFIDELIGKMDPFSFKLNVFTNG